MKYSDREYIEYIAKNQLHKLDGWDLIAQTDMHRFTWSNLEIHIGAHYLFLHCGNCEHHFSISDIRAMHPHEVQDRDKYPICVYKREGTYEKCIVCCLNPANFVAIGDPLSDQNPSFYCDECLFMLHYSHDGRRLHDSFHLFPYGAPNPA